MNRKERRAAKKSAGPAATPMAATLAQAFRAHQAGHRSEAERMYRDVLAIEPRNAGALHLLGALMHQTGHSDEAISLMRQAVAIEPRNADYHYNLGSVLNAAGRTADAVESLSKATALNPQYAEAHFELGNAHARGGQFDNAEKSFRRTLELQPGNAAVMNNLGRVLLALRRTEDAAAIWERAVTLQPDLAIAHFNIGLIRYLQNRLDDAEDSLRRALAARPDYPEALQRLTLILVERGRAQEALPLVADALSRNETADLKAAFAQCILAVPEFRPEVSLRDLIRRAIAEAWATPAQLAPIGTLILKAHPVIGAAIRRVTAHAGKGPAGPSLPSDSEIQAIAQEPLFITVLEAAPNTDIETERFLTALRLALLQRAQQGHNPGGAALDLVAALARQCFLNQYVFVETEDERRRVEALLAAVVGALRGNESIAPGQLAVLAAYRPLHLLDGAASLAARDWPACIAALLQQQVDAPLRERALHDEIRAHATLPPQADDEAVEPSPLWVKAVTTLRRQTVADFVQAALPSAPLRALDLPDAPDILVAPCGTGERAISIALSCPDAAVLAFDENTGALAYGRRQAQALNLRNIGFVRGTPAALDRDFDLIDASGPNSLPDASLADVSLISRLRPGALLRIGVIGDAAQREIAAARDFARQGNYQPDTEGIRLLRQNLLRLPAENAARIVAGGAEFFATGTCRALLFGTGDRAMSLSAVQSFAAEHGLEVLGLELPLPLQRVFAQRFTAPDARTDLAAWQAFERERPDEFAASYALWLQKPRG